VDEICGIENLRGLKETGMTEP